MEKVVQAEFKVKEKLFYCIAGIIQVIVPEKFLIERNGFIVKARYGFQISITPSNVISPKGPLAIDVNLSVMKDIEINCDIICDLQEEDQLYKGVIDQMVQMKL